MSEEKTNLELLKEWFEKEKANGLVDVKFSGSWQLPFPEFKEQDKSTCDICSKPTEEELAGEILELNRLIVEGQVKELPKPTKFLDPKSEMIIKYTQLKSRQISEEPEYTLTIPKDLATKLDKITFDD